MLKEKLSKIKFNKVFDWLKNPAVPLVLGAVFSVYALASIKVSVSKGPLLVKIFGTVEERESKQFAKLQAAVLPENGAVLPIVWGDLGKKLVETGVIDSEKFEKVYENRGGLSEEDKHLLYGLDNVNLEINEENSGLLLNLLWALGLGNKNEILEKGPMADRPRAEIDVSLRRSPKTGLAVKDQVNIGIGTFASTGGWTLAKGNSMDHYSKHSFVVLTAEQQAVVERVSKNIYRPCCGNSTYFPDCNHGMAMLGLLELMASQNISEKDMYKYALQVNSLWFPDTYLNIAKYLKVKKIDWDKTDPKELLGANFSSASGYRQVLSQIQPETKQGGGSCGI